MESCAAWPWVLELPGYGEQLPDHDDCCHHPLCVACGHLEAYRNCGRAKREMFGQLFGGLAVVSGEDWTFCWHLTLDLPGWAVGLVRAWPEPKLAHERGEALGRARSSGVAWPEVERWCGPKALRGAAWRAVEVWLREAYGLGGGVGLGGLVVFSPMRRDGGWFPHLHVLVPAVSADGDEWARLAVRSGALNQRRLARLWLGELTALLNPSGLGVAGWELTQVPSVGVDWVLAAAEEGCDGKGGRLTREFRRLVNYVLRHPLEDVLRAAHTGGAQSVGWRGVARWLSHTHRTVRERREGEEWDRAKLHRHSWFGFLANGRINRTLAGVACCRTGIGEVEPEGDWARWKREMSEENDVLAGLGQLLRTEKYVERVNVALIEGARSVDVDFDDLLSYRVLVPAVSADGEVAEEEDIWDGNSFGFELLGRMEEQASGVWAVPPTRELLQDLDGELSQVGAIHSGDRRCRLRARLVGLPEECRLPLPEVSWEDQGRLVEVEGLVLRRTERIEQLMVGHYVCKTCNTAVREPQEGDFEVPPYKCPNTIDKHPKGKAHFELDVERSLFRRWQRVVLQEAPETMDEPGRRPAKVTVELTGDMVGVVEAGDRVRTCGVVGLSPKQARLPYQRRRAYRPWVDACSVAVDARGSTLEVTQGEMEEIEALVARADFADLLRASLAPGVRGMEMVKDAVLGALFGGVPMEEGNGVMRRGDIHVLLLGDPGTGKTSLLKNARRVAPRAVFTVGKGSTAAGLTASVLRGPGGNFVLRAGALPLADLGLACMDEFGQMDKAVISALHEVMENGRVSVAKADITASLNARATILASGNPKAGRFDPDKIPAEQHDLPPPLISRFDLIFPVPTRVNVAEDTARAVEGLARLVGADTGPPPPPIRPDLMRKLIWLARTQCHPRLTQAAADFIREHWVDMRRAGAEPGAPIPVTDRQLWTLAHLTQARARMHLRATATVADAEWAWGLVEHMLVTLASDPYDPERRIDIDRLMMGRPMSIRRAARVLVDVITGAQEVLDAERAPGAQPEGVLHEEVLRLAGELGVAEQVARAALGQLRRDGSVYQPQGAVRAWRALEE
jgi:replicative DNA helicase Mcm